MAKRDAPPAPVDRLIAAIGVELDPAIVERAVTHRSWAYEHGNAPTNERLEFLGDAVLGLAVTEALFDRHPDVQEGQLAKLRAAVVNSRALADVARGLELGSYLRLGRGEETSGGRDKSSILADALEAVIGAVHIDRGPQVSRAFVLRLFAGSLELAENLGAGLDWKTSLQELCAVRGLGVPDYAVTESGPDHAKHFVAVAQVGGTVVGGGEGSSKKEAEQRAAEQAWEQLSARPVPLLDLDPEGLTAVPELPEVETVRAGLARWVVGRRIASVEVTGARTLRRHEPGPADFAARVTGRRIEAARRRGKYLWLPLDDGAAILGHLGMSGQFLVSESGVPDQPHVHARFRFDDGGPELRFADQRTFGGLSLDDSVDTRPADAVPGPVAHIARDPVDPAFDRAAFTVALRRRRTGIKRALLDQSLISGVGNIYADEALWQAKMHYARATDGLRRPDVDRLLDAVDAILAAAIAAGGTSFDALYVAVNGQSGYFDRSLQAYGRDGEPCSRCGQLIRREAFMNRSSYRCPRCQPVPRQPRW